MIGTGGLQHPIEYLKGYVLSIQRTKGVKSGLPTRSQTAGRWKFRGSYRSLRRGGTQNVYSGDELACCHSTNQALINWIQVLSWFPADALQALSLRKGGEIRA